MRRIAITGSSGYLGQKLVRHFKQRDFAVFGTDLKPGEEELDGFLEADIRDPALVDAVRDFAPDTVIHGAFAFQPLRDDAEMTAINCGGTENIFRAVEVVSPERFLLVSSATAYGAWPDNPVPMPEDWQLRARTEYKYAADKTAVEALVAAFAEQNRAIHVSWIRPSIIGGPGMANYLSRFIFGMPFLAMLDGNDTPLQFVHEDDVVRAVDTILAANGRGAFNVGPPNWTLTSEIAAATDRRCFSLPFWLAWSVAWFAWNTQLWIHESPAGFLYFARYPWVVAPERLTTELGFQFEHTSSETVAESWRKES